MASLVQPYTVPSGSSGVGMSIARHRLDQQKFGFEKEKFEDKDYRALVTAFINARETGDFETAKLAASELKRKYGIDFSGDLGERPQPEAVLLGDRTVQEPVPEGPAHAPIAKKEARGGSTEWLERAIAESDEREAQIARASLPPGAVPGMAEFGRWKLTGAQPGQQPVTEGPAGHTPRQSRVIEAFDALINGAPDEYGRSVAIEAQRMAYRLAGFTSPEKAYAAGMNYYNTEMDRRSSEQRALGGRGSGAIGRGGRGIPISPAMGSLTAGVFGGLLPRDPSNSDVLSARRVDMAEKAYYERNRYAHTKELNRRTGALRELRSMVAKLTAGDSGLENVLSMASLIKMNFGAAASDREREFIASAVPAVDRILAEIRATIVPGGPVPRAMVQQMLSWAHRRIEISEESIREKLGELNQLAQNPVEQLQFEANPEQKRMVSGWLAGVNREVASGAGIALKTIPGYEKLEASEKGGGEPAPTGKVTADELTGGL